MTSSKFQQSDERETTEVKGRCTDDQSNRYDPQISVATNQCCFYTVYDQSAFFDTFHSALHLSRLSDDNAFQNHKVPVTQFFNSEVHASVSIETCRMRGYNLKSANKTFWESLVTQLDIKASRRNSSGTLVFGDSHLATSIYSSISRLPIKDENEYYVQTATAEFYIGGKCIDRLVGITGIARCDDKENNPTIVSSIGVVTSKKSHTKSFRYFKPVKVKNKKQLFSESSWCKDKGRLTKRLPREHKKSKYSFEYINKEILEEYLSLIMTDLTQKGVFSGIVKVPKHVLREHTLHFDVANSRPVPTVTVNPFFEYYARVNSFVNWSNSNVSATDLARAGFYLSSNHQRIECHQCGLNLRITDLTDTDPLTLHQSRSPNCTYLREITQNGHSVFSDGSRSQMPINSNSRLFHGGHSNLDTITRVLSEQNSSSSQNMNNETTTLHNTGDNTQQNRSVTDLADNLNRNLSFISNASNTGNELPEADQPNNTQNSRSTDVNNTLSAVAVASQYSYPVRNQDYIDPQKRQDSYSNWNSEGRPHIGKLVEAGFYFTGNEDIVRCFHCDIGLAEWNAEDDPWEEHARHSPDCPYLRKSKPKQFIDEIQRAWARVYAPKHPEYKDRSRRLATFENSSWPRDYTVQTPVQLTDAGFYYTGEGDTVRCHYCDGGLREWDPEDDPWLEHARWFPFCKYVLKVKGIQYIQDAATGQGSRPADSTQTKQNLPPAYTDPGTSKSYVEECHKLEMQNPLKTAAAQSLMEMDYKKAVVQFAINKYIENTGLRDFTADKLLGIIFDLEDKGFIPPNEGIGCEGSVGRVQSGTSNDMDEFEMTAEALMKENQYLLNKIICLVCKEKERCMVFLPCGHRITCETCGPKQSKCLHCQTKVDRMVKTYLS